MCNSSLSSDSFASWLSWFEIDRVAEENHENGDLHSLACDFDSPWQYIWDSEDGWLPVSVYR